MKKIHRDYERYLDDQVHLKESTLTQRRINLSILPEPDKITLAWWKGRLKQIAPKTAQSERVIIFHVLRFLDREKQVSELKRIKLPRAEDSVTCEDLYTTEELEKIFTATTNPRDRAMIQVLYESATRASELLSMEFKDVRFEDDETAMITVRGKTGTREIPINFSVPALRVWMNHHPVGKGFIWISERRPYRRIIRDTLYKNVKLTLDRADVQNKKKILHMFRHTRITEFVKRGILGQSLHKLVGWTKKSVMEAVYVHLSTDDVVNEVRAKMFGFRNEEERYEPVIKSKKCPRCDVVNEPSARFCHKCNMPISEDAIVRALEQREQKEEDLEIMIQERVEPLVQKRVDESMERLVKSFTAAIQGIESTETLKDLALALSKEISKEEE